MLIRSRGLWRAGADGEPALLVRADPHAPGAVRAVQPLRNAAAFFAASIGPGAPEWLAPEERIVIW